MAPLDDLQGLLGPLDSDRGPMAAAAAAAVVVVTNSRRSMLLRLVIAMPSKGSKEQCQVSGAGCQLRIT